MSWVKDALRDGWETDKGLIKDRVKSGIYNAVVGPVIGPGQYVNYRTSYHGRNTDLAFDHYIYGGRSYPEYNGRGGSRGYGTVYDGYYGPNNGYDNYGGNDYQHQNRGGYRQQGYYNANYNSPGPAGFQNAVYYPEFRLGKDAPITQLLVRAQLVADANTPENTAGNMRLFALEFDKMFPGGTMRVDIPNFHYTTADGDRIDLPRGNYTKERLAYAIMHGRGAERDQFEIVRTVLQERGRPQGTPETPPQSEPPKTAAAPPGAAPGTPPTAPAAAPQPPAAPTAAAPALAQTPPAAPPRKGDAVMHGGVTDAPNIDQSQVEVVQQILGKAALPKHGIDKMWGKETQAAFLARCEQLHIDPKKVDFLDANSPITKQFIEGRASAPTRPTPAASQPSAPAPTAVVGESAERTNFLTSIAGNIGFAAGGAKPTEAQIIGRLEEIAQTMGGSGKAAAQVDGILQVAELQSAAAVVKKNSADFNPATKQALDALLKHENLPELALMRAEGPPAVPPGSRGASGTTPERS